MSYPPQTSPPAATVPDLLIGAKKAPASTPAPAKIPSVTGVGLKPGHYRDILEAGPADIPAAGWFEIHAENYMGEGGAPHAYLSAIRERFPLSIHGVGLSLGSNGPLDEAHLKRLKGLVERYRPGLISEHLAWCSAGGTFFNDLFPVPLTHETLRKVGDHINQTQDYLSRRILIENPSTYLKTVDDEMSEPEFLEFLSERTGCGILLDLNNVAVSCANKAESTADYLAHFPGSEVGEIHLAGHSIDTGHDWELRIDDHGSRVSEEVWALFKDFCERWGPRPTLIEWDTDVPAFPVLLEEAGKAREIMQNAAAFGPLMGNSHAVTR